MNKQPVDQVIDAEEKLRLAMLGSDANTLNELLSPDLMFTNHLGQRMNKSDDIAAHDSGLLTISALEPSDQQIKLVGDNVAVVSVRVKVEGKFAGKPTDGHFRFTRVWTQAESGNWQVEAAHAGVVSE